MPVRSRLGYVKLQILTSEPFYTLFYSARIVKAKSLCQLHFIAVFKY
jgi:hypothetical protein